MFQWMFYLFLIAIIFSALTRSKQSLLHLTVNWTGWLWILVFGAGFLNEILRSAGAPHINVFQSSSWQPLMPMLLGIILLVLWHRRNHTTN